MGNKHFKKYYIFKIDLHFFKKKLLFYGFNSIFEKVRQIPNSTHFVNVDKTLYLYFNRIK